MDAVVSMALDARWQEFKQTLDLDRLNREVRSILLMEDKEEVEG